MNLLKFIWPYLNPTDSSKWYFKSTSTIPNYFKTSLDNTFKGTKCNLHFFCWKSTRTETLVFEVAKESTRANEKEAF